MGASVGPYRLVGINGRYSHSSLALFYLRHALKRHLPGCRVELVQLTINDPYFPLLQRLAEGHPSALFFSAYIWNAALLQRLLRDLARLRPELPMVVGGPQAPWLGELPGTCTLVLGEVEGLGENFYQDLDRGCLASRYQGGFGNRFPFPYRPEDFDRHLRHRQVLYESSRGCPFSCRYCLSAATKGVVRKDPELVAREVEMMIRAGAGLVKFVDRTFNDDPDRALAIWRHLAAAGGQTRFHFEVAPDRFNAEMMDFLATVPAGRFQFEAGIQSTSADALAAVNRPMDVEVALETIRRLARPGNIHIHADLILGLPGEDEEGFRRSFSRLFACAPHHIQMGLLKVLPGTPLAGDVERHDILHCTHPPYEVLATRSMDAVTLARLFALGECVERLVNNRYFPSLWAYLRKKEEQAADFFDTILAEAQKSGFLHRAPTQKSMAELLLQATSGRDDGALIRELIRYDWLRCGHRFLPSLLEERPLAELREQLRKQMPQQWPLLYDHRSRNRFFRQGVFGEFSAAALAEIGLGDGRAGVVCFLAEREEGLFQWCRTVFLAVSPQGDRV